MCHSTDCPLLAQLDEKIARLRGVPFINLRPVAEDAVIAARNVIVSMLKRLDDLERREHGR
jgi:hypothetical protein